ncbi:galactose-3-O-sulfotransferase 2-like isoform X1 [Biomphalaria glabrata]|nr:galactose-3-O-sulfotransferase 2-like isoform X1 [Biomphalaria glabrata]
MGKLAYICFKCQVLTRRHPIVFKWMVLSMLVYLSVMAYILCFKYPMDVPMPNPPYVLGRNGMSLYEIDFSISKVDSFCAEKTNFVFIKGMKCATSTLLGVFYRFGYSRNLSFVSPLGNKIYLNWPFPMTRLDFRPSNRGYNILADHAIFTENLMSEIMPNDTIYISIVREPFSHVKSVIQYFNILNISGVPRNISDPLSVYFSSIEQYEAIYKSQYAKQRWCVPDGFSLTKNLMSHCHGMPLGFPPGTKDISNDHAAVESYLEHLDKKFSLIMIVEHFYESVILLRRLMCWAFKDIIFIRANVARYDFDVTKIDPHVVDIYRNWSSIDYRLFHYFNQTLWRRISEQGPKFFEEVVEFKYVQNEIDVYCQSIYNLGKLSEYPSNISKFVVPPSSWTDQFSVTPSDCWVLGPNNYELQKKVQKENDVNEAILLSKLHLLPDNRALNMKGLC